MNGTAASHTGSIILGEAEARILQGHLARHRRWNERAHVRIVITSTDVGVYAAPPMGVLSFIRLPLAHRGAPPMDVTVPIRDLDFQITVNRTTQLELPDTGPGPAELAVLPPDDGWHLPIHGVAGDVLPSVEAAIEEFKSRSVSATNPDALAEEIWHRPAFGGLPMRVLHTARLLGMLGADSARIAASTRTGWKRLTTIRGHIFVRVPGALDRPSLTVVR